jgi:PhnB protein
MLLVSSIQERSAPVKIHELFAYLCVENAAKAIEFYKNAFEAQEKFRLTEPSGRIGHAELDLGGTTMMLSDEYPEYGIKGPLAVGGTSVTIHIHVDNADEVMRRAVAAGAAIEREATDAFYGERSGTIRDPFGHRWNIGHSIEDVSTDEMQRRYTEMMTEK